MTRRGWLICTTIAAGVAVFSAQMSAQGGGPETALASRVDRLAAQVLPRVVAWRRDFHQHPELGNREVRTSAIIAAELRRLGFEVTTGVAHTGIVGVLRGGRPGPVVALRSDMDALPVAEQLDLPFKSVDTAEWMGQRVGVMHACGHDNHMAILLGAATVLAGLKADLPGTVKLIFQPAEEGAPPGEEGGAELMVKQGVLDGPTVDAVFGLHVFPFPAGQIVYRPGPIMASLDNFTLTLKGRQTHGALPWGGVDPIVLGSQVVLALQTIVSRTVNLTESPAVVTVGRFTGGNRANIIPEEVQLEGTVRTFDERARERIHQRIRDITINLAESAGATADVQLQRGYPVTRNDATLTERMLPTLRRVAGDANVVLGPQTTTGEDFAFYQQRVPGLFVFLGVTPRDRDHTAAAQNHSPLFFADESALPVGVRVMANLALDYLTGSQAAARSAAASAASIHDGPWLGTFRRRNATPSPETWVLRMWKEGDGIRYAIDVTRPDGPPLAMGAFVRFDGQPYPETGNPSADHNVFQRFDDRTLGLVDLKDGKETVRFRITYSPDGRTRTSVSTRTEPGGRTVSSTVLWDRID